MVELEFAFVGYVRLVSCGRMRFPYDINIDRSTKSECSIFKLVARSEIIRFQETSHLNSNILVCINVQ